MRPFPTLLACAALALNGPVLSAEDPAAVAAVKKLGGKVTPDDARPGRPVVAVSFAYRPIADADLAALDEACQPSNRSTCA